jgi:hypothetical protein
MYTCAVQPFFDHANANDMNIVEFIFVIPVGCLSATNIPEREECHHI